MLIEVAEISTAAQYVPQGLGLALVPRFAVADSIAGARVVSAEDAVPPFDLSLAWARRRTLSAAAEALVQLIRDALLSDT